MGVKTYYILEEPDRGVIWGMRAYLRIMSLIEYYTRGTSQAAKFKPPTGNWRKKIGYCWTFLTMVRGGRPSGTLKTIKLRNPRKDALLRNWYRRRDR